MLNLKNLTALAIVLFPLSSAIANDCKITPRVLKLDYTAYFVDENEAYDSESKVYRVDSWEKCFNKALEAARSNPFEAPVKVTKLVTTQANDRNTYNSLAVGDLVRQGVLKRIYSTTTGTIVVKWSYDSSWNPIDVSGIVSKFTNIEPTSGMQAVDQNQALIKLK